MTTLMTMELLDEHDTTTTVARAAADAGSLDLSPEGVAGRRLIEMGRSEAPALRAARKAGFDRKGTGHGMLNAGQVRNRWRVAGRHLLMRLVSALPGTRFKTRLVRRLFGVTMGRDVGLAGGVYLDPFDPTMISIGDNVIVGAGTRIYVHVFTLDRQRLRPVTIGNDVMIGGFCVIAPGVTIGDGASIAPGTFVTRNVPAGAIVMGNPMQIKRRRS